MLRAGEGASDKCQEILFAVSDRAAERTRNQSRSENNQLSQHARAD